MWCLVWVYVRVLVPSCRLLCGVVVLVWIWVLMLCYVGSCVRILWIPIVAATIVHVVRIRVLTILLTRGVLYGIMYHIFAESPIFISAQCMAWPIMRLNRLTSHVKVREAMVVMPTLLAPLRGESHGSLHTPWEVSPMGCCRPASYARVPPERRA